MYPTLYTVDVWGWRDANPEAQKPDWSATYKVRAEDPYEAESLAEDRADKALDGDWEQLVAEARDN